MTEPEQRPVLAGTRVVELGGMGPVPFAGMLLADMGADVIVVERPAVDGATPGRGPVPQEILRRGKRSIVLDLKASGAVDALLRVVEASDAVIEGFRPGVAERLGVGPEQCRARKRRLVYGRATGWGPEGPRAQAAGHDINFLALTGVLDAIGRNGEPPTPPLNLVGDFGGGGLLLAFGVVCALHEAQRSGEGQVVDAAMIDGIVLLAASVLSMRAAGVWPGPRGTNLIDSGAHFYDAYECADGRFIALGAVEPDHYARFVRATGFDKSDPRHGADYLDRTTWSDRKAVLARIFRSRPRAEWLAILEPEDCCCTPILDFSEASADPHNAARGVFASWQGHPAPAPVPRFSRSRSVAHGDSPTVGEHTQEVLLEHGMTEGELTDLGLGVVD